MIENFGICSRYWDAPSTDCRDYASEYHVALFGERFDVVFDCIATRPGCLGGLADGHASLIVGKLQYLYR